MADRTIAFDEEWLKSFRDTELATMRRTLAQHTGFAMNNAPALLPGDPKLPMMKSLVDEVTKFGGTIEKWKDDLIARLDLIHNKITEVIDANLDTEERNGMTADELLSLFDAPITKPPAQQPPATQ